jgi:lipoyl(octanoyl) transferase
MDLSPFNTIDPCGYRGLEVTQAKDLGINLSLSDITEKLVSYLHRQLNY